MAVIDNIDIGSCSVTWTPNGGSPIKLGLTKEGCTVDIKRTNFMVEADEVAGGLMEVVEKYEITADITLIEYSMANISAGLGALMTTQAGAPAKISVDLNPLRGEDIVFGKLVFHPRRLGPTVYTHDVTIWKASVEGNGQLIFKASENGKVSFSVSALADQVSGGDWRLLTIGDPVTGVTFKI